MALVTDYGSVDINTVSAINVSHSLGVAPKLILFMCEFGDNSDDVESGAGDPNMCFGFYDVGNTRHYSIAREVDDGGGSDEDLSYVRVHSHTRILGIDGGALRGFSVTGTSTTNFTVDWDTGTLVNTRVYWIAIAGSGVTVGSGDFVTGTTSSTTTEAHGLGTTPKGIYFINTATTAANEETIQSTFSQFSTGAWANSKNKGLFTNIGKGDPDQAYGGTARSADSIGDWNVTPAVDDEGRVTSVDGTNFTVTWDDTSRSNNEILYFCLAGADIDCDVVDNTGRATTGNENYTTVSGSIPEVLISSFWTGETALADGNGALAGTAGDSESIGMGLCGTGEEFSVSLWSDDQNATTVDVARGKSNADILRTYSSNTGTVNGEAEIVSSTDAQFTLNYTDAIQGAGFIFVITSTNLLVTPTGIASAEAHGATVVTRMSINPAGIAGADAYGTAQIDNTNTVIGTIIPPQSSYLPPIRDGNGNIYIFGIDNSSQNILKAYKGTDGALFSEQDSAGRPTNGSVNIVSAALSHDPARDRVVLAYCEGPAASCDIRIAIFYTSDHATLADTWDNTRVDEIVETVDNSEATAVCVDVECLTGTDAGDIVVGYNGNEDNNKGTRYQRCDIARYDDSASSWSATEGFVGKQVEGNSNTTQHFYFNKLVKDDNDKVYVIYKDETNGDLKSRSHDDANNLGTIRTIDSTAGTSVHLALKPAFYDAAGVKRITVPWRDGTAISTVEIDDDGAPSTAETASDNDILAVGQGYAGNCFVDTADKVYLWYVHSTNNDLYQDTNDNSGGWGTDSAEVESITADNSFGAFYNSLVATAYEVGTDIIYTELSNLQTITPTGVATADAYGTQLLHQQIVGAGIASAETIGTITLVHWIQGITGIASAEAFETGHLLHQQIQGSGFGGETIGTPTFIHFITGITGISSAEAFGTQMAMLNIQPSGIATADAYGSPQLNQLFVAGGISSAEAFGTILLIQYILPSSVSSAEVFGSHNVQLGGDNQTLIPSAIASAEVFGTIKLIQYIDPSAISSAEQFGTTSIPKVITPSGLSSAEGYGTAALHQLISGAGNISIVDNFGTAFIAILQVIDVDNGIASAEAFGSLGLTHFINATSVGSAEAIGSHSVNMNVAPTGIATVAAYGSPFLHQFITPSGMASQSVVSTAMLIFNQVVIPTGIASGEVFGATSVQSVFNKVIPNTGAFILVPITGGPGDFTKV